MSSNSSSSSSTSRAEVTIVEDWRGARVTWTARHQRRIIATISQGPQHGMWDSDPLAVAIGAHFGISSPHVLNDLPRPVRFVRKGRSDDTRIVPRLAVVDVSAADRADTRLCPRSGTRISQAGLKAAAYVPGRGWQAMCPDCGKTPGSRADGHVIVYADHEAVPACGRCARPAVGWPLSRPDVCSPGRWTSCIRDPFTVAAENTARAAAEKEDAEQQVADLAA